MENEKITNYYESVFIINQNINLKEFDSTISNLKIQMATIISKILKEEYYGIKRLAYEIKGQKQGYCLILKFKITSNMENIQNILSNIEKQARIDDNILKFITIKTNEEEI